MTISTVRTTDGFTAVQKNPKPLFLPERELELLLFRARPSTAASAWVLIIRRR